MDLTQSIIEATTEIFESMLMMEAIPQPPLTEEVHNFKCSVSGIVGLAGTCKGMISIHTPDSVAMALTGAFLGMEVEEIDEDVKDAIGELSNMLAGSIKEALSENGKDIKLSIPSTICGDEYSINCMSQANWVTVPFEIPDGQFLVELQIQIEE